MFLRNVVSMISRNRKFLMILGSIWLLDGLMQFKPLMLTQNFVTSVIWPNTWYQPMDIAYPIYSAGKIILSNVAVFDIIFGSIQVAIGLLLIIGKYTRAVIIFSVIWSVAVWWVGEGFGSLFTGQASLLTGAPGAVILYALVGIILYPAGNHEKAEITSRKVAGYALGFLFILGFVLQMQPYYFMSRNVTWDLSVNWFVGISAFQSLVFDIFIAGMFFYTGIGFIIFRNGKNIFSYISIALSIFIWIPGEMFGQIYTALGTDPNSGVILLLLSVMAMYPVKRVVTHPYSESPVPA
jgi:hypothetical protein